MNKMLKKKIITGSIFIIIGTLFLVCSNFVLKNLNVDVKSYINGFGSGLTGIGIFFVIKSIIGIVKPEKGKKMENVYNDERLWSISNKSMAITFRFSMLLEAVASLICAIMNKMVFAEYLAIIIFIQTAIYIITYFILSKKS